MVVVGWELMVVVIALSPKVVPNKTAKEIKKVIVSIVGLHKMLAS